MPVLVDMSREFGTIDFLRIAQYARGKKKLEDRLLDRLYNYFLNDMPYGVAKARTGDPDEWIFNKLQQIFKTNRSK